MKLVKVTLQSTGGEETTVLARVDAGNTVVLPARLQDRIRSIRALRDDFTLHVRMSGRSYALKHLHGATYAIGEIKAGHLSVPARIGQPFGNPTFDQLQAYGRLAHTLSAAAGVSLVGFIVSVSAWGWRNVVSVALLLGVAIFLLILGAIFAKGDY